MASSERFPGKRICQVISAKKAHLEEYKRIHTQVWDSVLDGLRRSHIVDYSINFLPSPPFALATKPSEEIGGLLIATFKYVGDDFEGDMKRAAEDEATQRWWKVTDGMQESLVEGAKSSHDGGWWYPCEEVFRHEE